MTADTDSRPPLSAPGFREDRRARLQRRKKTAIAASTVWMMVAAPMVLVFKEFTSPLLVLGGLGALTLSFFLLITWVIFSSRFDHPFFAYPLATIGGAERIDTYRHVGGTMMLANRIVSEGDYVPCDDCGEEFVDGVREEWFQHVVAFGVPLVRVDAETTFYCQSCRPDAWGDHPPDIPTCDLVNPDESDVVDAGFGPE